MDMSELTPEQIEMMMQLGVIPAEQDMLQEQMGAARAIRDRAGPQGRDTGATFVAANPLEHIGEFMQKRKAGKEIDQLTAQQKKLLEDQVRGRSEFYKSWAGSRPGATPAASPFGPQPFKEGGTL